MMSNFNFFFFFFSFLFIYKIRCFYILYLLKEIIEKTCLKKFELNLQVEKALERLDQWEDKKEPLLKEWRRFLRIINIPKQLGYFHIEFDFYLLFCWCSMIGWVWSVMPFPTTIYRKPPIPIPSHLLLPILCFKYSDCLQPIHCPFALPLPALSTMLKYPIKIQVSPKNPNPMNSSRRNNNNKKSKPKSTTDTNVVFILLVFFVENNLLFVFFYFFMTYYKLFTK